jgi:membrane fusion protein (multidrug efflux system)
MSNPQAAQSASRPSKRWRALLILTVVFGVGGGGYGFYWNRYGQFQQRTENAYVGGHLVYVTPQVSGIVTATYTDEAALVSAGELLVELDTADAKSGLDVASAALAAAAREVGQVYATLDQAAATVELRQAELEQAQRERERREALSNTHTISDEELTRARSAERIAAANLAVAQRQLQTARTLTRGVEPAAHPRIKEARARLVEAYLALQRTRVVAPVDGYVAKRGVNVGQHVEIGASLMAIVPLRDVWVDANFKETQLRDLRIGQPVELQADAYASDVVFHGKVAGISPGTGAVFALLPAQNATGNWIKVLQRVPVRIQLDAAELAAHPLRLGLTMTATVDTHDRQGAVLGRLAGDTLARRTDTAHIDIGEAELLAAKIIGANLTAEKAPQP